MPIRQARRSESVRWRTGSLPAESAKLADIHLVFVYGYPCYPCDPWLSESLLP